MIIGCVETCDLSLMVLNHTADIGAQICRLENPVQLNTAYVGGRHHTHTGWIVSSHTGTKKQWISEG